MVFGRLHPCREIVVVLHGLQRCLLAEESKVVHRHWFGEERLESLPAALATTQLGRDRWICELTFNHSEPTAQDGNDDDFSGCSYSNGVLKAQRGDIGALGGGAERTLER